MPSSTKISPPNSLLFISDIDGGDAPYPERGPLILSTPSCISVACYPEQDGPTEVTLGKMEAVDPGDRPAFDDDLETPGRAVRVSTVEGDTILEMKVPQTRTHVRIWVSHSRWPDKVIIGVG